MSQRVLSVIGWFASAMQSRHFEYCLEQIPDEDYLHEENHRLMRVRRSDADFDESRQDSN